MLETRVHLSPPEPLAPHSGHMPIARSRQWFSSHEDGPPAVAVFMGRRAYRAVNLHASSDMDNEVGGALVGRWCTDVFTGSQYIVIETALPARFTRQGEVFLTFTQDSLVEFQRMINERYPGKLIVGWYHTHPRMGVFLSRYDTWLHQNFFPEPWQVALVVEPFSQRGGFFIARGESGLDPHRYYGFFEMGGKYNPSQVKWNNLTPAGSFDAMENGG